MIAFRWLVLQEEPSLEEPGNCIGGPIIGHQITALRKGINDLAERSVPVAAIHLIFDGSNTEVLTAPSLDCLTQYLEYARALERHGLGFQV